MRSYKESQALAKSLRSSAKEIKLNSKHSVLEAFIESKQGAEVIKPSYEQLAARVAELEVENFSLKQQLEDMTPDLEADVADPCSAEEIEAARVDNTTHAEIEVSTHTDMIEAVCEEVRVQYKDYIPFHIIRDALPALTRDQVDNALYALEQRDVFQLSTVVEAMNYTTEQLSAAIPQRSGGNLFYVQY